MNRATLTALLLLAACDKTTEDPIEAYQDGDELVVDIQAAPRMYTETCTTTVVQLAQIEADEARTPLETSVEDVADRYAGYWLDGRFVYPATDEGCDMVMCIPVDDDPRRTLVAYTVAGEDDPPDDLAAWIEENGGWMDPAESVSVVESAPISGAIEVTLSYFDNDTCSGALQTLVTTAYIE